MRCPICNFENPAGGKFCANCGNRLPEVRRVGSERRVITALFCDVKGSTALAEKLDPEEWTEVIDGAFRVLTPPVQRYGGTVARLLGDAVLAFFGAPVAHEDDPERAVRAGLEMLQATDAYRELLVRERGAAFAEFDIRIGINTGLAVIGDVGSGQAIEYTGMGDAVNVAARLQSLAEPGTMLVSDHTLKLVPPVFDWEPAGALDTKGRGSKVQAFEVRGLSSKTGYRSRGRVLPLVGRETEVMALRDGLTELRRGGGRIVSIVGDAGMGKTRLIDELRREWEASPVEGQRWSEARGQSYEQTRSYGLFRQHLLSLAGVADADSADVIRSRVTELLPEALRSEERAKQALEILLAVETGAPAKALEGAELRTEVHRIVKELARSLAVCQAVLVFDDLQWADPASADLLSELVEIADESSVLFILAFRPERQAPSWRIKQKLETDFPHRYTELELRPLTADQSAALLTHAVPGKGIPEELCRRILDKAEGNPFFLEEIVRALVDEGTIVRDGATWRVTRPDADITLPGSLQGVLAARIDNLDSDARDTLQAASVIGRTFQYRVLVAIREATDRLDRQLRELQRLELVREQAREPEREYAFRHALTQEAAYRSILQRKRRELHLQVGEALETLLADRSDESAAMIGHHFAEAADPRAVPYLKTAADRALRLYALDDAISQYQRALALIKREEAEPGVLCELFIRHGRALELRGDYAEALAGYQELEALARQRSDPAIEGEAISAQVAVYSNPTPFADPIKAAHLADRAIELARARGDELLLAKLLWSKAQTGLWSGQEDGGLAAGLESAEIARRIGAKEQLAFTLNALGQTYRELNRLDESERALREAIELFHEVGNRSLEADSISTLAFVHVYRSEYRQALEAGERAFKISDEIDNDWGRGYALFSPSYVHYELGNWGKSLDYYEASIGYAEKGGFLPGQVANGSDLALLYATIGDLDKALSVGEHSLTLARTSFPDWLAWPLSQLGRVHIIRGELDRARAALGEAHSNPRTRGDLYMSINTALGRAELALAEGRPADAAAIATGDRSLADQRGMRPFEKSFDLVAGRALLATGDLAGARAALERGIADSRATGSLALLWSLLATLAAVADAEGKNEEAARLRSESAVVVDHIATSLRARGLEETFRARASAPSLAGIAGSPGP